MTGNEITLGGIGASVILSILLRMIYATWEIQTKYKPWIAVGAGMLISLLALWTLGNAYTPPMVASYIAQGFMTGATAVGLYEMTKSTPK